MLIWWYTEKGKTMQTIDKIKNFNTASGNAAIEPWKTRFGTSVRFVKRSSNGTFVSNVSAKQVGVVT
jgi:hypothetical protein